MQYSKGDTLELYGGIGIVLDNGTPGIEFHRRHARTEIYIFAWSGLYFNSSTRLRYVYQADEYAMAKRVWYNIMIGDRKGWYGVESDV